MAAATSYTVATATTRALLITAVIALVKQSYKPIGGVAYRPVDGGTAEYMQAMVSV